MMSSDRTGAFRDRRERLGISQKHLTHGYAADAADAAAKAVNAGVDMEMTSSDYYDNLAADIKNGTVSEKTIDDSVRPHT